MNHEMYNNNKEQKRNETKQMTTTTMINYSALEIGKTVDTHTT